LAIRENITESRRVAVGLALSLLLAATFGAIPLVARSAPAAYGQQFVQLGQAWPEVAPPVAASPLVADDARRAEYQRQLAERELRGGPYTDALAEPLAALARYHRDEGNIEQAKRFYRRALHVVRINDGLYSERQVPVLRELLNTYRIAGDMRTLDERYEYFFRLFGNGQPPHTDLRLRAALEYLRWQREAMLLELDGKENRRLLEVYQLNDDLLQATAVDETVDPAIHRRLALSQLHNLYLIQHAVAPDSLQPSAPPTSPLVAGDWTEQDVAEHRLESIQRGAVNRGANLIRDALERDSGISALDSARLLLELADWYQWNGREESATRYYAEVEQLLAEAGDKSMLREWFGQPVELPDNGAFWQPGPPQEGQRRVVVKASFDVSERGRASNIETRVAKKEDGKFAALLRRKLARTRFRPQYAGGQFRSVSGLSRQYELVD
jgi:hypothetical protein